MLERIIRYVDKQIANGIWYDGAWFIGGYMYIALGKWLDSTFMVYSAIPYAFLLLGYSILLTVLFYRRRQEVPMSWQVKLRLFEQYVLSLILIYYAFTTQSELSAQAIA